MLQPTHANPTFWFFPLGNTPASDLLRHRPLAKSEPDEDGKDRKTKILLACGDPRYILYTFWCHAGQSESNFSEIINET